MADFKTTSTMGKGWFSAQQHITIVKAAINATIMRALELKLINPLPEDLLEEDWACWSILHPEHFQGVEKMYVDVVNPPFNAQNSAKGVATGRFLMERFPLWRCQFWRVAVYGTNALRLDGHDLVATGIAKIFRKHQQDPTKLSTMLGEYKSALAAGKGDSAPVVTSSLDAFKRIMFDLGIEGDVNITNAQVYLTRVQNAVNTCVDQVDRSEFKGTTANDWMVLMCQTLGIEEKALADTSHDALMKLFSFPDAIQTIFHEAVKRARDKALSKDEQGHYRDVYRRLEWVEKLLTKCFGPIGCATDTVTLDVVSGGYTMEEACDPGTDRSQSHKYFAVVEQAIKQADTLASCARLIDYWLIVVDNENDDLHAMSRIVKMRKSMGYSTEILSQASPKLAAVLQQKDGLQAGVRTELSPGAFVTVVVDTASRNNEAAVPTIEQHGMTEWLTAATTAATATTV